MIEKAVAFGPDRGLVGIWTEPTDGLGDADSPAFLICNSGIIHHCGVWRFHVRLARNLAARGIPSFRFDLSGIGDSNQSAEALPLDEMVRRDYDAAVGYLRDAKGQDRVISLGLCSGARDSLEAAERHTEVVGVVAIDLIAEIQTWHHYANHFGKRLFRLGSWKSTLTGKNRRIQTLVRTLAGKPREGRAELMGPSLGVRRSLSLETLKETTSSLLQRGNEFLFLYSNGVEDNYNHLSQFAQALPRIAASPRVAVEFFPDADHTFSDPDQQRVLIKRIVRWAGRRYAAEHQVSRTIPSDFSHAGATVSP